MKTKTEQMFDTFMQQYFPNESTHGEFFRLMQLAYMQGGIDAMKDFRDKANAIFSIREDVTSTMVV